MSRPRTRACAFPGVFGACAALAVGCSRSDLAAVDACSAGTAERRPLALPDGLEAYVEPVSLLRVGRSFVVVGSPTYTWMVGGARATQTSANAHIAAYLDASAPRLVAKPLDVPVGMVRAVALDEGRWGVLFSESVLDDFGISRELVGIWYAEYDGARWSEPEPIPLPSDPEITLVISSASPLVRQGGALSWAVTDLRRGTFHYERRNGAWRVEVVEDRGGEAAALASEDSVLWLAVSGLDPDISGPRKSIRLFRWRDGWSLVRRYPTAEPYTEIHRPSLVVLPGGITLTWIESSPTGRDAARARVGLGVDDPGVEHLIDGAAQRVAPLAIDDDPVWIVEHIDPVTDLPELRVLRADGGRAEVSRAIPYPYTGWYAATPAGPDEVLVTGPEFDPDPARASVRSLTLRLNLSCR
jgi:hypothetical protein